MGEHEHRIHLCLLKSPVVSGVCPPILACQDSGVSINSVTSAESIAGIPWRYEPMPCDALRWWGEKGN